MLETNTTESVADHDVYEYLLGGLYEQLLQVEGDVSRIEVRRSTATEYLYRIYMHGNPEYEGGILSIPTGVKSL
jgi:hypothetical protein